MTTIRLASVAIGVFSLAACSSTPAPQARTDTQRIIAADTEPGSWLTHGRTYGEQRFSPLTKISTETVGRLGLAWTYEMRTNRGAQATPLVADGVMYVTSAWSLVYALDAATGAERWVYDPKVDRAVGAKACCDVVNRGVALHDGKVFVGVDRRPAGGARREDRIGGLGDGHGRSVAALHDHRRAARRQRPGLHRQRRRGVRRPRLCLGLRGRHRQTPWRFYTVPGDPSKGPDNAASDPVMARAAATWNGQWWTLGGGGTVWDAIVYDADFNQLIVGVGNGSPWNQQIRSPGGGDNLFLVLHRRARCRHRRLQVALPDHTGRDLGLHGDAADRACRAHDRRQAAEGRDAGAEERLLLCRGSRKWPADFRPTICAHVAGERHTGWTAYQLGVRRRLEDGPAG